MATVQQGGGAGGAICCLVIGGHDRTVTIVVHYGICMSAIPAGH